MGFDYATAIEGFRLSLVEKGEGLEKEVIGALLGHEGVVKAMVAKNGNARLRCIDGVINLSIERNGGYASLGIGSSNFAGSIDRDLAWFKENNADYEKERAALIFSNVGVCEALVRRGHAYVVLNDNAVALIKVIYGESKNHLKISEIKFDGEVAYNAETIGKMGEDKEACGCPNCSGKLTTDLLSGIDEAIGRILDSGLLEKAFGEEPKRRVDHLDAMLNAFKFMSGARRSKNG